jgi:hypothetical protein
MNEKIRCNEQSRNWTKPDKKYFYEDYLAIEQIVPINMVNEFHFSYFKINFLY